MAKMTCYVVTSSSKGTEVFLDEQKARDSFYDQLYAYGVKDNKIKKWMDEYYDRDKYVLADILDDMCYYFSLEQTILNY